MKARQLGFRSIEKPGPEERACVEVSVAWAQFASARLFFEYPQQPPTARNLVAPTDQGHEIATAIQQTD